jgi:hypothetical protein
MTKDQVVRRIADGQTVHTKFKSRKTNAEQKIWKRKRTYAIDKKSRFQAFLALVLGYELGLERGA